MKKLIIPALALLNSCSQIEHTEMASLSLPQGYQVIFKAKKMAQNRQPATCSGVCICDNQLYISALTNPPERVLTKGCFVHDGVKVDLDVSGLANPWVDPKELEASDCTVETCKFGDNEVSHRLKVRFVKGGAEDYACEWVVYQDKSLRMNISYLDDEGN